MFNGIPTYRYEEVQETDGKWALLVVPDEVQVVKMIFTWYLHGDGKSRPMTIAQITRRSSEMKVPTQIDLRGRANVKTRGYGVWARGTVWNMLKNETYAGRCTYADTSLEVSVPEIISPELWRAAQARLAENRAVSRRNLKHDHLLRRRGMCGECGLKMQGKSKPSKAGGHLCFYYRCPALARTMYVRDCNPPIFRVDQVDPVVWEWAKSLLRVPSSFTEGLSAYLAKLDKDNEPLRERVLAE